MTTTKTVPRAQVKEFLEQLEPIMAGMAKRAPDDNRVGNMLRMVRRNLAVLNQNGRGVYEVDEDGPGFALAAVRWKDDPRFRGNALAALFDLPQQGADYPAPRKRTEPSEEAERRDPGASNNLTSNPPPASRTTAPAAPTAPAPSQSRPAADADPATVAGWEWDNRQTVFKASTRERYVASRVDELTGRLRINGPRVVITETAEEWQARQRAGASGGT